MIGIVAALGLGGYWLRRWIAPEFSGALARLGDGTLAVALLIVTLEALGTIGILRFGWIVVGCIGVGLGAAWLGWSRAPAERREVAAPAVHTLGLVVALGVASFTVAEWTFPSQLSLDQGMFGGDTTWYHMPFSAAMAQDASTWPLHYTDPLRLAPWFYPASTELINAATIVLFDSDWLAPLQNLIWLPIALLRRLVHRPPLQGRPGDLDSRGDRPRRRRDDRNPARGGAQRHHGPGLPACLRRLPDQRPPAARTRLRRGRGTPRTRTRRCSTRGRWCWRGSPPGSPPRSSSPS